MELALARGRAGDAAARGPAAAASARATCWPRLGLADLEQQGVHLRRTAVEVCRMTTSLCLPPDAALLAARHECVLVGIAEQESYHMKQEMLINVAQPEECRIAIVEDGVLEELYVERAGQDNYVGNIYKGVVVNLEPSIQAAFVDFGVGRNGFLHISDIEPQYFRQGGYDPDKPLGPAGPRRPPQRSGESAVGDEFDEGTEDEPERPRNHRFGGRPRFKPPIQEILRRGDEVLVQVIKEGIGTKGPTLSTYISIPGRYLVLMPALGRIGVSRKIEDEARPPPAARHHARTEPAQGRGLHRPHRRQRPHQARALPRHGLPAAALEGHRPADQETARRRRTSTKKAT